MSRSVCTNRSSIVLMSFEKKPMTFIPFLVQPRSASLQPRFRSATCNAAGGSPRASDLTPECHVPDLGTRSKTLRANRLQHRSTSARESARTLIIRLRAIGEARVAEAGSDGQDAPVLHVLHERHLAQTLHHAVVMHERDRLVSADLGNGPTQACRKVEVIALPIAGKILCATGNRAVLFDHAWTANADEGSQIQ